MSLFDDLDNTDKKQDNYLNLNSQNNIKMNVLQTIEKDDIKFEVLEYDKLNGGNFSNATELYFANKMNIKLRQAKITLNNSKIITEAGSLYFYKGHIQAENKIGGVKGFLKGIGTKLLGGETIFRPQYFGIGEIFLEPSFSHFALLELENESIIVDKGMFYACSDTIDVTIEMQKNISTGLFGGESFFQTKLCGTGICLLDIPVPFNEIMIMYLNNEELKVDGNFALLRTEGIDFSITMSSKGIIGTLTSGEGFLQTFRGTGQVWIAPTSKIYNNMSSSYIEKIDQKISYINSNVNSIKNNLNNKNV